MSARCSTSLVAAMQPSAGLATGPLNLRWSGLKDLQAQPACKPKQEETSAQKINSFSHNTGLEQAQVSLSSASHPARRALSKSAGRLQMQRQSQSMKDLSHLRRMQRSISEPISEISRSDFADSSSSCCRTGLIESATANSRERVLSSTTLTRK